MVAMILGNYLSRTYLLVMQIDITFCYVSQHFPVRKWHVWKEYSVNIKDSIVKIVTLTKTQFLVLIMYAKCD